MKLSKKSPGTAKLLFHSMLGVFVLAASATADIPKKAPITRYTGLWTNSPFTSKPPPAQAGATVNPLDDFTLTGIAQVPGGYRITIISKKNPEEKEIIEPGRSSKFTVVSVNRNPDKALGTSVVLSTGAMQGTVTFEPELLTLKAAPAAPQPQQNLPPGINPAQVNQQQSTSNQRQQRPRIVPPPTPTNGSKQAQPSTKDNKERSNRRNR